MGAGSLTWENGKFHRRKTAENMMWCCWREGLARERKLSSQYQRGSGRRHYCCCCWSEDFAVKWCRSSGRGSHAHTCRGGRARCVRRMYKGRSQSSKIP